MAQYVGAPMFQVEYTCSGEVLSRVHRDLGGDIGRGRNATRCLLTQASEDQSFYCSDNLTTAQSCSSVLQWLLGQRETKTAKKI